MNGPSIAVVNEFARAFAQKGKGKGMTKEEILAWFRRYSNNVVDPEFYGMTLTKEKMFHHCLERLHIEDQYRALIDLCCSPPTTENSLPDETQRKELLERLHAYAAPNGLTIRVVTINPWEVRREWLKVIGRLEKSPEAAITSARTLLEKACKEVLRQTGSDHSDLRDGDLTRLVKKARKALGLKNGVDAIVGGISAVTNGMAELSNRVGDRHAVSNPGIVSLTEARLACDICLSLSVFLLDELRCKVDSTTSVVSEKPT